MPAAIQKWNKNRFSPFALDASFIVLDILNTVTFMPAAIQKWNKNRFSPFSSDASFIVLFHFLFIFFVCLFVLVYVFAVYFLSDHFAEKT